MGEGLTDRGLETIAQFRDFDSLGVGSKNVTDDGLLRIPAFPSLTRLTLFGERMTDRAVDYVQRLPKVAWIRLERVRLTDAGLVRLAKVKTVKELLLFGTEVTATGVKAFRKERGDCYLTIDGAPADEWLAGAGK